MDTHDEELIKQALDGHLDQDGIDELRAKAHSGEAREKLRLLSIIEYHRDEARCGNL